MSNLEKNVEKYLKKIKALLPNGSYEKMFLQDLEADIFAYAKENKINDFKDLKHSFDSPNKVAGDFLADMSDTDMDSILRKRIIRLYSVCFISLLVTIMIISITLFGLYYYKAYTNHQSDLPTKQESTIEIIE